VTGDLSRAHTRAYIGRTHCVRQLVIEAGEAPLVFRDQQWLEAALPVPWYLQSHAAAVGHHVFSAVAIAAVAGPAITGQVMVHLRVQRTLGQRFLELVQQAALLEGRAGFRAGQQMIQHHVRNLWCFATRHGGSPYFPP